MVVLRRGALQPADLTKLYRKGMRSTKAVSVAERIAQAARRADGLAADVDRSEAFVMAAELYHRSDYRGEALRCAEEAIVEAGELRVYPRAWHARLLVENGRQDEGWTALDELRPLMSTSFEASTLVPETLEAIGAPDTAVRWLTEAIGELRGRQDKTAGPAPDPLDQRLLEGMIECRHQLRTSFAIPVDESEDFEDTGELEPVSLSAAYDIQDGTRSTEATVGAASSDQPATGPHHIAVLYWPELEFEAFAAKWPSLAEGYGGTWEGHRAEVAATLATYRSTRSARVVVVPARFDDFLAYASDHGLDPTGPGARSGYALELGRAGHGTAWPPERNASCWCGSGLPYKKCCRPASRQSNAYL